MRSNRVRCGGKVGMWLAHGFSFGNDRREKNAKGNHRVIDHASTFRCCFFIVAWITTLSTGNSHRTVEQKKRRKKLSKKQSGRTRSIVTGALWKSTAFPFHRKATKNRRGIVLKVQPTLTCCDVGVFHQTITSRHHSPHHSHIDGM